MRRARKVGADKKGKKGEENEWEECKCILQDSVLKHSVFLLVKHTGPM